MRDNWVRRRIAIGFEIAHHTRYRIGHAVRQMNARVAKADSRESRRQQHLAARLIVRPTNALQILETRLTDVEDARLLGVFPGSLALLVDTISYDIDSIPVEYGISIFRADKYKYVVRLSR